MSVHFNDMILSQFTPCAVYTSFHRTAEPPPPHPQLGPGPSNPGFILLADKVPHPKTQEGADGPSSCPEDCQMLPIEYIMISETEHWVQCG